MGMTVGFLQSYSLLVIRTCHKRGVHAMGGMAAQIPIKNNPEVNNAAIAKVMHHPAESVRRHYAASSPVYTVQALSKLPVQCLLSGLSV